MRGERGLEHARILRYGMIQKSERPPHVILSESCCSEESRRTLQRPASATHRKTSNEKTRDYVSLLPHPEQCAANAGWSTRDPLLRDDTKKRATPHVILSESCCSEESRRTLQRPASATHRKTRNEKTSIS